MTGKERVDRSQFFQLSTCEYRLRGHTMKLSKQRTSFDVRKFSFSQRVALANLHYINALNNNNIKVMSRCCGRYVCESVQGQIGPVLAKMWALKAWLNQPVIRQVQGSN